jgi:hypothetical protein
MGWQSWTRTYGGAAYDDGFCVQQTAPDSGYVIAGSTRSFGAGVYDIYVLKTEPVLAGITWTEPRNTVVTAIIAGPNPFRYETRILYRLSERCRVDVGVYNVLGRQVATLIRQEQDAGMHTVTWDGGTNTGSRAAGGMYYIRIEAAGQSTARKLLLLR